MAGGAGSSATRPRSQGTKSRRLFAQVGEAGARRRRAGRRGWRRRRRAASRRRRAPFAAPSTVARAGPPPRGGGRGRSRARRGARPSGERSSWLMAPSSSRWPRTMASMRSAMRLKLTATSRTSCATQRRRRPADVGAEGEVAAAEAVGRCARRSSGRASWLATRSGHRREHGDDAAASASTKRHQAQRHGPRRRSAPSRGRPAQPVAAHDRDEDVLRAPRARWRRRRSATRVHARGQPMRGRGRGERRSPVTSRTSPTYARVASGSSQTRARRAATLCAMASAPVMGSGRVGETDERARQHRQHDGAEEPPEEPGP